jgi:NADH dehydrogenase
MILVTGATGFIGQHLVRQLAEAQFQITMLVRPSRRERSFAPGVRAHIVVGDVDDLPALRLALHHVTHVVHLAGIWEENERDTFAATNVQGTQNLIDAMHEVGVKRLITVSSLGAHTHSAYPFLRVKAEVDDVVEASGLEYTILESSAVYGPGDSWTEVIALALSRFPFFFPVPGSANARLQPLLVSDLVKCLIACLTNDKTSRKTFDLGGPQHLTYDDLVSTIMQAIHVTRRKRYVSAAAALRWSNWLRGLLGGRNLYSPTEIDLLSIDRTTSLDAVSFHFSFTPVRLASALNYLR